jgi:hypothetical protein
MPQRFSKYRVAMARCAGSLGPGLVAVSGLIALSEPAQAVPARRLARRGVIVVVPPVEAGPAAAPIVPAPAPIMVGPGLRPLRRLVAVPPPPAAIARQLPPAPAAPGAVAAPQPPSSRQPAVAKSGPPAVKPPQPTAVPESIPAPQAVAAAVTAGATATHPEQAAFTPEWYAAHPQAWRPAEQPLDWWRVPDTAAVVDWLAGQVRPAGGAIADVAAVTTAGGETVGDDGLRSVLVLPAGHANQEASPASPDRWLPLGVFAVVPRGVSVEQASQYQQLLVDRAGVLRGNFYDDVSGTVQPIEGAIDRSSLSASWAVQGSGSRFTLPVAAFAAAPRLASVTAGGRSREVELVPVARP